MVVAGVSTVVFNGNPLLRYDGYYILADLLEIPNLAQRATRYWGYLVDRYVFRTDGLKDFVATGRRAHLAPPLCAGSLPLSPGGDAYDRRSSSPRDYLAVGVAIAIWSLFTAVALPIGKALWQCSRARAFTATAPAR